MKSNEFEKYITELSPDLQEKARQCANMDELNKLLADNDVELSEDALAAVAGGGSCSNVYSTGYEVDAECPECGQHLYYWDEVWNGSRYYCDNSACIACQENWLFQISLDGLHRVK